jgi:signal transduction histidine kinase
MSPAEPKPPSSPASKGWYDTLISGVGTLDALPTGFDIGPTTSTKKVGWRLRGLFITALLGCVALAALVRMLWVSPWIDAQWTAGPAGQMVLVATDTPALKPLQGQALQSIQWQGGQAVAVTDTTLLRRAPRWVFDDASRQKLEDSHTRLGQPTAASATLQFAGAAPVAVPLPNRGLSGIGWAFWPLAVLALVISLVGFVVWLARPDVRNALYLLLCLCQGTSLTLIAIQTVPGIPVPLGILQVDVLARLALDLTSGAALVHLFTLHPQRLTYGPLIAAAGWLLATLPLASWDFVPPDSRWWFGQSAVLVLGTVAALVLWHSYRIHPSAFTATLRRLSWAVLGSLLLLMVSLLIAGDTPGFQQRVVEIGSAVWTVFFASVLLLVPFLARSRQLLREFALLAGISTVATSLDLLFITVFSLGEFASVALSVFLSLGAYAFARDWVINRLTGSNALTLDRIFEELYRVGRAVEQEPERRRELMEQFLRDLYEPMELHVSDRGLARSRVVADGSALLIPAPHDGHTDFDGATHAQPQSWILKHAHRGKRLFTVDDARLADRVLQHLRRAVMYDRAVERGRTEERRRIAQDLHDDIGARLLTLMYKAPNAELEDYLRHTLQDLKTLTRGLAASEHLLSHAVAEWKADIGQRLAAAQMTLHWSFTFDQDFPLSVTQWSGLTRILRELVSNAIYHAQATKVHVEGSLHDGRLLLWIADDGKGRDPSKWSHGLGLGGVRKRVRALGGAVRWRENGPRGIICEVQINHLHRSPSTTGPRDPEYGQTRY